MAPKSKQMISGYKVNHNIGFDHKTIKRNERERNRVQNLNSSFEVLRQNIPGAAPMKKMSKIQILHQAVNYIQYLHRMMEKPEMVSPGSVQYEQSYPHYYQGYSGSAGPLSPLSPHYDSDTSGIFSDYSMTSPNTSDWSAHQVYQQSLQFQQTFPEVTSTTSTTNQVSEDEDDEVIEAIADWQRHL